MPELTGFYDPQQQVGVGPVGQDVIDQVTQENYYRTLSNQELLPTPEPGMSLADYAAQMYFVNSDLGLNFAERAGIPREAFLQNTAAINDAAVARRREGMSPFQGFVQDTGESMIDAGPWKGAGILALLGYGGAQAGLFGGASGPGGYGAAGAAADGLTPIATGASTLPGGIPAIEGAASGAFGGAIPPLAGMSGAVGGLSPITTGASMLPGGVPEVTAAGAAPFAGGEIPPMANMGSLFSERLRNALGSFGNALTSGSLPEVGGGYAQGGGMDNGALMQMMNQLLQRQRIQTPQGPMGPRYKPYG
jgi:hypothetical protein